MSRQNTLKLQLLGGISLRQDRLNAINTFVERPYGDGASERWQNAVSALITFKNDVQSVLIPNDGLTVVVATLPGGTVWYLSSSTKNTYENFINDTISSNRNLRGSFQQALNNESGFGFEVLPSSSLSPSKPNASESRVTMRLGDDKSNVIAIIGLSCIFGI